MAKAQTCYYPNSTASQDSPCHSDNVASACCSATDTCLSNGLCLHDSVLSRGSCTDQSWESSECPQYCKDVSTGAGDPMYLVGLIRYQWLFCCSPWNNGTCDVATNGSKEPFSIEDSQVILNRTSGSTSTNTANAAAVTETGTLSGHATATSTTKATSLTSPSNSSSVSHASLSCSNKEAAVGAGLGLPLGLALLVALGLLWRQRKHTQRLMADIQTTKAVTVSGAESQQLHQLPAWTPDELDGRPKSLPQEMSDRRI